MNDTIECKILKVGGSYIAGTTLGGITVRGSRALDGAGSAF